MRSTFLSVLACLLCLLLRGDARADNLFPDAERAKITTYWNEPGRYTVSAPPDADRLGPWQVRLTPEASLWFFAYQKAVGAAKAPPTVDAAASAPETKAWEDWVQAKLACDRWSAQRAADTANAQLLGPSYKPLASANPPPFSGPVPVGLVAAAGDPPPFATAAAPLQYTVTLDESDSYRYQDHVQMRPRYAYYRFDRGTVAYGTPLRETPAEELQNLFEAAGFSPSEQHVMAAVSKLEGGFDAINTYDTGYVSVGFIQFITHEDGKHSLIEVLQREKADDPDAYQADFRRFGVDFDTGGTLVVVDPATGAELSGRDAVMKVIDEKRLTAVFQHAGKRSRAFRLAQVKVAKSHYWPADDPVKVPVGGQTIEGKVSDVIRSEAGLATLFDRKVNRGSVEPISAAVAKVMADHNLTALPDAAAYEREIIQAVRYRTDFLKDASLSQPK